MADSNLSHNEYEWTVSEINAKANDLIRSNFKSVWIVGEVFDFTAARSGHWYFTLKDQNAELRCVMFRRSNFAVSKRLNMRVGMQIRICADLSIYEDRGSFQAIVQILEDVGEGERRRQFEELRDRLAAEGLFDEDRKRALPPYPRSIAIISSPTADAKKDVITNIERRFPCTNIVVIPTSVQGETAHVEIVSAFTQLEKLKNKPDVVVVTRGGGSLEDLWSFNHETVARAIVACSIPVVSAIGHEADVTIADFVADKRAATPSTAAELITPELGDLLGYLASAQSFLAGRLQTLIDAKAQTLDTFRLRLGDPNTALTQWVYRLEQSKRRIHEHISRAHQNQVLRLTHLTQRLQYSSPIRLVKEQRERVFSLSQRMIDPRQGVAQKVVRIKELQQRIHQTSLRQLQILQSQFQHSVAEFGKTNIRANVGNLHARTIEASNNLKHSLIQQLERRRSSTEATYRALRAVSPIATLDRGYAVVTKPDGSKWGKPIKSILEVNAGEEINAHLAAGTVSANVTGTTSRDD